MHDVVMSRRHGQYDMIPVCAGFPFRHKSILSTCPSSVTVISSHGRLISVCVMRVQRLSVSWQFKASLTHGL